MSDGDAWARHVDELIGSAWLPADLAGRHVDELWGRLSDDLARIEREVAFAMLGEEEAAEAHAPGSLRDDAKEIAAAAEALAALIRRSRPLLHRLVDSDPTNAAHCHECGHIAGGISRRYWTQPVDTDLSDLATRCRQFVERTAGSRKSRRPRWRTLWLHRALWAFRNHVARVVVFRPDLLPPSPGRMTQRAADWDQLDSAARDAVWADALLVQREHRAEFVASAVRAQGLIGADDDADFESDLTRHPYPVAPQWRDADSRVRPDLRETDSERLARDYHRHRPLFVPGFDYEWEPAAGSANGPFSAD